jgi:hypothetical protein
MAQDCHHGRHQLVTVRVYISLFHITSTMHFDNNSQFQKTNKCTILSSIVQYPLLMFRFQLNHLQGVKITFILHPLANLMI